MGKTRAVHRLVIGQFKSLKCDAKKTASTFHLCRIYSHQHWSCTAAQDEVSNTCAKQRGNLWFCL